MWGVRPIPSGAPPKQGALLPFVAGAPSERISIDLTGTRPPDKDSRARYILTVVDHFTKWAEACPLPNKEATTVAGALSEQVFTRHGMPVQMPSDQGNEVDSSIMRETCRLYGVDKVRTTVYKPYTSSVVERFHRTLNSMLGRSCPAVRGTGWRGCHTSWRRIRRPGMEPPASPPSWCLV